MSKGILIQSTLKFSAKIIKLQQYLIKQKKETIISKQIIRSATSIGANINEANYGSSKQDFIAKMHIALKECSETEYWLRLLKESEYIDVEVNINNYHLKEIFKLQELQEESVIR